MENPVALRRAMTTDQTTGFSIFHIRVFIFHLPKAAAMTTGTQAKADDLEQRLIEFGVRIINLSARLPRTAAGKHIASQILRSGTSPAPNYGEARGGETAPISCTSWASF